MRRLNIYPIAPYPKFACDTVTSKAPESMNRRFGSPISRCAGQRREGIRSPGARSQASPRNSSPRNSRPAEREYANRLKAPRGSGTDSAVTSEYRRWCLQRPRIIPAKPSNCSLDQLRIHLCHLTYDRGELAGQTWAKLALFVVGEQERLV